MMIDQSCDSQSSILKCIYSIKTLSMETIPYFCINQWEATRLDVDFNFTVHMYCINTISCKITT
jgi:hypothetical protein